MSTKIQFINGSEIAVEESVPEIDNLLNNSPSDHSILGLRFIDGRRVRVAISQITFYCDRVE